MIVTMGSYAAHFATAGWLLFAVLYGGMAPWWRSSIGRNVLVHAVVLAITFGLVSVQLIFGVQWPAREWVRLAIFVGVAGVAWWRLFILFTDQIFAVRQSMPTKCRECGK